MLLEEKSTHLRAFFFSSGLCIQAKSALNAIPDVVGGEGVGEIIHPNAGEAADVIAGNLLAAQPGVDVGVQILHGHTPHGLRARLGGISCFFCTFCKPCKFAGFIVYPAASIVF